MPSSELLGHDGHCALVWTPAAISTLVVGLRIWLRARLRILGAEDQLMIIAWVFQIIAAGLTQGTIDAVENNAHDTVRISTQGLYNSLSCVISIVCGKISVALLILRLIGHTSRWRKWSIIVSVAILIMVSVAFLPANSLDVCDYYDPKMTLSACVDPMVSEGLIQSWNFYAAGLDIFYSVIPITFLHRLQMNTQKKVCVSMLLGLGWIAAVFTILRAVSGYAWGQDSEKAVIVHLVANYMEPALVIICGSLATLMPLSERWSFRRSTGAKVRDSYLPPRLSERESPAVIESGNGEAGLRTGSLRKESADELLPQIWVERMLSVNVSSDANV